MLVESNRMIVWVERYGLRKDEIAQMLHNVVGEDVSIPQSEAAEQLGNSLRRGNYSVSPQNWGQEVRHCQNAMLKNEQTAKKLQIV